MKQRLNWEIEEQQVLIGDYKETSQKALVRSDNKNLLGIRSKYYHPIFNRDLEAIKEKVLDTNLFLFKGYEEFNSGKRILLFFQNIDKELSMCGEKVQDYLIIGNSNDASSKLFVGTSNYMFRCENQFSERIRTFEWKHDRPFNLNDIDIPQLVSTYETGRRRLYKNMSELKQVKISRSLMYELAEELLNSEKLTDKIENTVIPMKSERYRQLIQCINTEINELGPTMWGLFNGVTRYTSNHINGKPGFGIVNGIAEKMNREALKIIRSKANIN